MASQLEQLLTCCICLDRFRNPKLLPCQHSVCMEPCMEGLVDYVRRQVKCPECRAEHRIPYNGVQGYPSNVTLQRFLEAHIEITGEQPDPHTGQLMERCAVCNEKNYLTTCSHCDKKICDDCKTAHSDILKREIGRINNQVKRAINRLRDQQVGITRYIHTLKSTSDGCIEEIDSIERRLLKAVRDRCNFLKNEADNYYTTELRNLKFVKEGLEQEVSNAESNSELADKHMNDQIEWDDCELMDAKEIFLRTMEFIRGFDYDSGEFNRKARFNGPDDLKKIITQVNTMGEFIINSQKQPVESYSTSCLSGGLMKSKSDHRLAAQFRDHDESLYNVGRSSSPSYRRKFGERPAYTENNEDSSSDTGRRRFRSRFIRRDEEDDKLPKFEEDTPKPRQRVIDTEDVSRGPLSGITRMFDSPRVIQRLQEKDKRKKKDETVSKAYTPPTIQSKSFTSLPSRKTVRQQSNEDEIDKIKKQNKSESSLSSASTPTLTPKPTFSRGNSVKENSEQPSRATIDRTYTTPRNSTHSSSVLDDDITRTREHTTNRVDNGSGTSSRKTSMDVGPSVSQRTYAYSRSSSTSSIGDSNKSSSSRPPKPLDTVSIERRLSRSNSSDSNRSFDGTSSSRGQTGAAFGTDELKNRFQPKSATTNRASSGSTRFQSRFLGRAGTPSVEASRESGNDEDDDEEEDESSEETDSEETDETSEEEEKISSYGHSNNPLIGRSSQARDTSTLPSHITNGTSSNDSGVSSKYGSSTNSSNNINSRYGISSTSNEMKGSPRPSHVDISKSSKEKDDSFESKYPYASKYLNRTRDSIPSKPTEDINFNTSINTNKTSQNGSISKSKTSALLSQHNTQNKDQFKSLSTAGQGSSRAKFEELKEKRQRLARSKSSAGVEEDDSVMTEPVSSYRSRYGKENDSSATIRASTSKSTNVDDSSQLSNWARYLKNKYGNRTGATSNGSSGLVNSSSALSRSRSSHLLGLAKEDSSEDDSKNVAATPTARAAGMLGPTPFGSIHRNQYLQKQQTHLKIGSRGSEAGNFTWPRGIAIGPNNIIVVADSSNHRVQVFDQSGNYKKQFGKYGNGDGQFDCLAGVAVNNIGQFIIADRYNHRIQIFDQSGSFLRSFGSQGNGDGKFSYPWGIATDSLGYIYVCDKENHRVQVFQSDGSFAGKFGTIGNKPGQLEHPHYIAVSSTNQVIVSDSNNHRVQIFDVNGKVLATFGSEGSEEGQFKFPRGVAVDEQNFIFVADSGNNRIQVFNADGTFLRSFGCWGSADGEFKGLEGVAVTQKGKILVCDRENHRVQMF